MRKIFSILTALMLLSSVALAGEPFMDNTDGRQHIISDTFPMPTRYGLVWKRMLNLTIEQCDADLDGSADNFTALVKDTDIDFYFTDDGGVFVDDTTDMNDAGANDVQPWPSAPAVADASYWGGNEQFNSIKAVIGTSGSTVMTVVWEYSTATGFVTLPFVKQELVDFDEAAGTFYNVFTPPFDWAATTVNSQSAFWVRVSIVTFTSVTTDALVTSGQNSAVSDSQAHELIIHTDSDATTSIWCRPLADDEPDVNEGGEIKEGGPYPTVQIDDNAVEVGCCGEGGTVAADIWLFTDGN